MSTIVYQDSQSFTTTIKLKLPTPTTIVETTLPHQENKCWSSLQSLSTNYSKEKENSYVHPLSKRPFASSRLSEKSLALCTENLGSENGTDHLSCTDSSLLMPHPCRILQKYTSFGESEMHPLTYLKSQSNIADHIIGSSIFSYSLHESKTKQSQTSIRVESNYNKVMTTYKNSESCQRFPPPLTTLRGSNAIQVRSHREGDRLVIKAIEAPKMRNYFHAERSNGRLRLCLLSNECTASKSDLSSEKTNEEEKGELEVEKDIFESEINEEEEENGMYMKGDMDGNSYDVEVEIGIGNCQRMRRCNQGRQDNKKFCDWRNPFWVATS